MLIGDPLGEGSNASSTDNELWRAENSLFTVVTGELERNERACLSLTHASLSP